MKQRRTSDGKHLLLEFLDLSPISGLCGVDGQNELSHDIADGDIDSLVRIDVWCPKV